MSSGLPSTQLFDTYDKDDEDNYADNDDNYVYFAE
jgi:hypothetical protein